MGFFDLFSSEGRRRINANYEYAECKKIRANTIRLLRYKAHESTSFKYPDCIMLFNFVDSKYMVLTPSRGTLELGRFADSYCPNVGFVEDEKNSIELIDAVDKFKGESRERAGRFISAEIRNKFINEFMWNKDFVSNFEKNGFVITEKYELKYVIGASLFLDGRQIARSSLWKPKAKGHFSEALLQEIVEGSERNPSVRHLRFVIFICNPVGEGGKIGYDLYYSKSLNGLDKDSNKEFSRSVAQLRDFSYVLEDYFKAGAPYCDADKLEYIPEREDKHIDSLDFDEDVLHFQRVSQFVRNTDSSFEDLD